MKKILLVLILIVALAVSFTACGGSEMFNENPLGLDFFPKDDGTYAVEIGKAKYLSRIEIPATYKGKPVTEIGNFSNYPNSNLYLKEVVIPDSVTSIGYGAFSNCSSLTSVEIPDSVTSIGGDAFRNCSSLTSIMLPFIGATKDGTTNTHFGYIFGASSYNDNHNYVPSSLKEVVITSATSIGSSAFYWCDNLTSVVIPDSVTSIGDYAFRGCSSLTSVEIPDSVTSIGNLAFNGCRSLMSVVIPNSVTSIGSSAFSFCSGLTSIVIPDSVTSIGEQAFNGCRSLTSVEFKDTSAWYYTSNSDYTGGSAIDVTDTARNAAYLKGTYCNKYWYKE